MRRPRRFPRVDAHPTDPGALAVGENVVVLHRHDRWRLNLISTYAGQPIRTVVDLRRLEPGRVAVCTTDGNGNTDRWLVNDDDADRPVFVRVFGT